MSGCAVTDFVERSMIDHLIDQTRQRISERPLDRGRLRASAAPRR